MFDKSQNKLPVPTWLRRELTSPEGELGRGQRAVKYSIELGRHCAGELRHDKAGQMAAALTYHTLFSMLPTMVLILVSLKAFVSEQDREQFKEEAITWVVQTLQGEKEAPKNEAGQPIAQPPGP